MTTVSSTSQSTLSDTRGSQMSSRAPISASVYLANSVGNSGELAAHLGDVVGVVHAHAHDLTGVEHERREVGGVERVLGAGHVLVAVRTFERVVPERSSAPTSG